MVFPILGANTESAAYEIDNSLRFWNGDYLKDTTFGTGTNRKKFTFSFWIKMTNLDTGGNPQVVYSNDANDQIGFTGDQKFRFIDSGSVILQTNRFFRDVSAWYHIVLAVDTTQGTGSNRYKLYVNGTQETSLQTDAGITQNTDLNFHNNETHSIGRSQYDGNRFLYAYLAEFHAIDGQQLDASYFGETNNNGVWIPKEYTGTYGNNGIFMEFKQSGTGQSSSSMGADTSGNDNHFVTVALDATNQTTDTPTNNFATMNPLIKSTTGSVNKPTYSEGNCLVTNHADGDCSTLSTIGVANGKWYFEAKFEKATTDVQGYPQLGWAKHGNDNDGGHVGFHTPDGSNYRGKVDATVIANAFDGVPAANDIIGFYLDVDNGTLIVHQNGSDFMGSGASSGLDFSSTTFDPDIGFFQVRYNSNSNVDHSIQFNFGNPTFSISSSNADANGYGSFEYSPTLSGTNYYALCTKNLAEYG